MKKIDKLLEYIEEHKEYAEYNTYDPYDENYWWGAYNALDMVVDKIKELWQRKE